MPRQSTAPRTAIPAGQQRICPHCGALALDQSTRCPHCDEDYGPEPRLVPSHFEGRFWVGIETAFHCHSCGHVSPLNHLDIDGSVTCLHCGIEQRFDPNQWWGALSHAHAVGDLAGPRSEGRFPNDAISIWRHNPFRDVGLSTISVAHEGMGKEPNQHALRLRATPGNPLCGHCKTPLGLSLVQPPELELLCPACGDTHRYLLPDGVRNKVPDLVGVVGEEHEKGRRDVILQRTAEGRFTVRCPMCSAPVDVLSTKTVVACKNCHTTSRVTDKILRLLRFERPRTEMWWALFEGPSKLRSKLERTERKALARAKPRHVVPLVPDSPLGDDMMRPLPPERRRLVPIVVGALLAVTTVAVVLSVWEARSPRGSHASNTTVAEPITGPSLASAPPHASARVGATHPTSQPTPTTARGDTSNREPLVIRWRGQVVASRGSSAKRGAPCNVEATVVAGKVDGVLVRCGEAMLYDSRATASADAQTSSELFELPTTNGEWRYRLKYVDTAREKGRSQPTLNSFTHSGVVFSEAEPRFRIEFSLEPDSVAREGAPLFDTPRVTRPELHPLVVSRVSGKPRVAEKTKCELRSHFVMVSAAGPQCKARLSCGAVTLYGAGESGYGPCRLVEGRIRAFSDDKESFRDSDPALDVDLDEGMVTLRDSPQNAAWSVTLTPL